mgnify:CR=1 FL=1
MLSIRGIIESNDLKLIIKIEIEKYNVNKESKMKK